MKILVIGKGGREHALALACSKSKLCTQLYMAPGNPGMAKIGTCVNISDSDVDGLVAFAKEKEIDRQIQKLKNIKTVMHEKKEKIVLCETL